MSFILTYVFDAKITEIPMQEIQIVTMTFRAISNKRQPIKPIRQHFFAQFWSALKKAIKEFQLLAYSLDFSNRYEKGFQLLVRISLVLHDTINYPGCIIMRLLFFYISLDSLEAGVVHFDLAMPIRSLLLEAANCYKAMPQCTLFPSSYILPVTISLF